MSLHDICDLVLLTGVNNSKKKLVIYFAINNHCEVQHLFFSIVSKTTAWSS